MSGLPVAAEAAAGDAGSVNLHDWIDELMDVLDLDLELDEALVLDVAREAAHRVQRPAAPISTFLLGYAAALADGDPREVEKLAARTVELATRWEGGTDPVPGPLDPDLEIELGPEIDPAFDPATAPSLVDAD